MRELYDGNAGLGGILGRSGCGTEEYGKYKARWRKYLNGRD